MINLDNAQLTSYSHESKFLGDGIFRYANVKKIGVRGFIDDLSNTHGASGVVSGTLVMMRDSQDFHSVIINGHDFGSGRVTSLNFDRGDWVRLGQYSVQFEVYASGDLTNMTGVYYSGANAAFIANYPELLESFNESFSFDIAANGDYSYSHDLNVKFYSGIGHNPIGMAKSLANSLILNYAPFGFINDQYSGFYNAQGRRLYNESYNLIDGSCTFSERFELSSGTGTYFVDSISNAFALDAEGNITVTENASIKGLIEPRLNSAISGTQYMLVSAFDRCSGLFDVYAPDNSYPLINRRLQQGTTLNKFAGEVSYNVSYSNNPRYHADYILEYTSSIDRNENNIYSVGENGSILGRGKNGDPLKFARAFSARSSVLTDVPSRCQSIYSVVSPQRPLHLVEKSDDFSRFRGEIKYNRVYSDDLTVFDDDISRVEISVGKKKGTHMFVPYAIFNNNQIVQIQGQTNLAEDSVQINITYKRNGTTRLDGPACLARAVSIAEDVKNAIAGSDKFLDNAAYELDPLNGKFQFSATFVHAVAKGYTDTSLDW